MCPVCKIRSGIQRIEPTHIRVERKVVLEVVVTKERRVLAVDDPIATDIKELAVQQARIGNQD